MYKKLSSVMALLLITTLFLAACQTATHTPKNYEGDCPKAEVLCVGLVTGLDGIDDHSFNQTAWEGMLQGKDRERGGLGAIHRDRLTRRTITII